MKLAQLTKWLLHMTVEYSNLKKRWLHNPVESSAQVKKLLYTKVEYLSLFVKAIVQNQSVNHHVESFTNSQPGLENGDGMLVKEP